MKKRRLTSSQKSQRRTLIEQACFVFIPTALFFWLAYPSPKQENVSQTERKEPKKESRAKFFGFVAEDLPKENEIDRINERLHEIAFETFTMENR